MRIVNLVLSTFAGLSFLAGLFVGQSIKPHHPWPEEAWFFQIWSTHGEIMRVRAECARDPMLHNVKVNSADDPADMIIAPCRMVLAGGR